MKKHYIDDLYFGHIVGHITRSVFVVVVIAGLLSFAFSANITSDHLSSLDDVTSMLNTRG